MKFNVYEIAGITAKRLFDDKEKLLDKLINSKEYNYRNLRYCLNNLDMENSIIGGTLSQEYIGNLYTVENKVERPIEENPWEKTYFFIDTSTAKLLLHKRTYKPKNLKHGRSETRLNEIINDVILELFGNTVSIIKTSIGENNEYFKKILAEEQVESLKVGNLLGKKIDVGTPLHNPREDWDIVWAESYNTYDSEIIEEVEIKVTKGKDIRKSVIHKGIIAAKGSEIKTVKYYDTELSKSIVLTNNSVGSVNVDANSSDEPATVLKRAFEKIKNSRDVIKKFNINL